MGILGDSIIHLNVELMYGIQKMVQIGHKQPIMQVGKLGVIIAALYMIIKCGLLEVVFNLGWWR
jgi:hypothetical protein